MRSGPILIIEDDDDDQLLLSQMVKELSVPNQIRFFNNGQLVLDYLKDTTEQPFLILCDINMPLMNGLELRHHIDHDDRLRRKAIPFIFLSTDASPSIVEEAYRATIQGFFKKAAGYEAAKKQLEWILGYWQHCIHPHNNS